MMESPTHPGISKMGDEDLEDHMRQLQIERDNAVDELNRIKESLIQAQSGQLGGELMSAFAQFQSFDSNGAEDELMEENRELQFQLEEAMEELREVKAKVERQQNILDISQLEEDNNLEALQDEIAAANKKISALEDADRKRALRELDMEAQLQTLRTELDDSEKERDRAEKQLEIIKVEKTTYMRDFSDARSRAEDLELNVSELRSNRDALEFELTQIKEKVEGTATEVDLTADSQMDYSHCREILAQFFETDGANIKMGESDSPRKSMADLEANDDSIATWVNMVIQHCRKLTREALGHHDEVDSMSAANRDLENEIESLRQEMEADRKRASKQYSERAAVIAKHKAEHERLNAQIRQHVERERQIQAQLAAKEAAVNKLSTVSHAEVEELRARLTQAKADLGTRKAECCCANRYNGRYLGQVSIPTNRPNQEVLWEAIDKVKESAEKAGQFEVSIMTVPGHSVQNSSRRWPKMLHMCTENGRHSLVQPFTQILSVGQVEKYVIFVCWIRMKGEPKKRTFLVHVVEFNKVQDAEAMSKRLIVECEEVHKRKGVIEDRKQAVVVTRRASSSVAQAKTPKSTTKNLQPRRNTSTVASPAPRAHASPAPRSGHRMSVPDQPRSRKPSGVGDWLTDCS